MQPASDAEREVLRSLIATAIGEFRTSGGDPRRTQEVMLALFPAATSADYGVALTIANARERRARYG